MTDHDFNPDFCQDDVHHFFGLSYSNYLALPRSIMQSMPAEWQHKFAELIEEANERYGGYEMVYTVHKRDAKGRFVHDELADYQRGRRFIEPKPFDWSVKDGDRE